MSCDPAVAITVLVPVVPAWEHSVVEGRWRLPPIDVYQRSVQDTCTHWVEQGANVNIAALDTVAVTAWCAEEGLDPAEEQARLAYAHTLKATIPWKGSAPAAVLESALQDSVAMSIVHLDIDPAVLDRHRAVQAEFALAAGGRIETQATLTVTGGAIPGPASVEGRYNLDVDLRWEHDRLVGITANHTDLADTLLLLGWLNGAELVLACRNHDRHPLSGQRWQTIYRWRIDQAGLHGLTEAQTFAASCTDPYTGDPVPPGHAARYASTAAPDTVDAGT